ncbi:MAG TPA: ROK family protein, partial [Gaiellales bacterium]|nr:ROK family protein [Gaiellales bacterium]
MVNSSFGPVVGVDLGGTTVKAALVSPSLQIVARDTMPTEVSDEDRLLAEIEQLVRRVAGDEPVAAVGFGLPSQIDQRRGIVADSINVPLTDVPFVLRMTERLDLLVKVDNDANVACLAEARIGAGKGRAN